MVLHICLSIHANQSESAKPSTSPNIFQPKLKKKKGDEKKISKSNQMSILMPKSSTPISKTVFLHCSHYQS